MNRSVQELGAIPFYIWQALPIHLLPTKRGYHEKTTSIDICARNFNVNGHLGDGAGARVGRGEMGTNTNK